VTDADPFADLSSDARERLEALAKGLERVPVGDLMLYAVRPSQPAHQRAAEAAAVAASSDGIDDEVRAAQDAIVGFVARAFRDDQLRMSGAMLQWGGSGPVDDRVRISRSLADAVTALVVWDRIDETDRAELLGEWARLLP
jgi:hypothetical protein